MPERPASGRRLYRHPRHWPLALGLGLLRLSTYLPYSLLLWLGRMQGHVLYYLMPRRRRIVTTNLQLCFPQWEAQRRQRVAKESFVNMGISLFEVALSWWADDRRLQSLVHVDGLEHLDQAAARGQGIILLSAHFTCLEIAGRLLALHRPFHVVYKHHRNELFEAVMKQSRETHFEAAIERREIRQMISALKQGATCWYALDQDFGIQGAVFAPFLGVPAATLVATSRLARLTGAAVVPFFPRRRADNRGYDLQLLPALADFPCGDDEADTVRINALIGEQVEQTPAQYLWAHRRFKTRPPGEDPVYGA